MADVDTRPTDGRTGDELPWHLKGNWAPVSDEVDVDDLEIEGTLPAGLAGRYIRNGMNPRGGWSDHWFFGHGMLHAVDLDEGRARYRNRYVRTPYYEKDGMGLEEMMDAEASPANTHIVRHAGRLLALEEQHLPYELDDELGTVGVENFDGRVDGPFTAHPRICPTTGELFGFGYNVVSEPHLTYYRVDPKGKLAQVEPIEIPHPVMMHDWNLTANNVVFMDLPVRFSMEKAMAGDDPFYWDPDAGARLGVMPRTGSNDDVRWHEVEPCYVFHPVNAHEDGDQIVLTVCRLERAMAGGFGDIAEKAKLWRWTIDTSAGTVAEEQLDDRLTDFPRVDDRLIGLPARYGYTAELAENPDNPDLGNEIYRYDLQTGQPEVHRLGANMHVGEPVFAPAGPDAGETDGWVVLIAHDTAEGRSELRVIDAADFSGAPVARVFLPQRVPYGAHGSWIPAA